MVEVLDVALLLSLKPRMMTFCHPKGDDFKVTKVAMLEEVEVAVIIAVVVAAVEVVEVAVIKAVVVAAVEVVDVVVVEVEVVSVDEGVVLGVVEVELEATVVQAAVFKSLLGIPSPNFVTFSGKIDHLDFLSIEMNSA